MDLIFDTIRLINAVCASLVFGALCYRGRLYFHSYDKQAKLLYCSFTTYALGVAYASVEAFTMNASPAFGIIPFTIANTLALYAFIRYRSSVFV